MDKRLKITYKNTFVRFYDCELKYIEFFLNIRIPYKNCFKKTRYKWVEVCSVKYRIKNKKNLHDLVNSNIVIDDLLTKYDVIRKLKKKFR